MRTLVWILAGIIVGLIIHIAIILGLPAVASNGIWARLKGLGLNDKVTVLADVPPGAPNPMQLDPTLNYAVCRVDLTAHPGLVTATLPDAYWSLAIFDKAGTVLYSTTNRDGIGQNLDVGIFNADQTHLLAEQKIDVADGLLIVEADENELFVVVRLAPPNAAVRQRLAASLRKIKCGNIT